MALKSYICITCGAELRSFKMNKHCGVNMREKLASPAPKFMEVRDAERNRHVIKDQDKILKQRAKDYIRDVELEDMIEVNKPEVRKGMGWLNSNGTRRKKIDEI